MNFSDIVGIKRLFQSFYGKSWPDGELQLLVRDFSRYSVGDLTRALATIKRSEERRGLPRYRDVGEALAATSVSDIEDGSWEVVRERLVDSDFLARKDSLDRQRKFNRVDELVRWREAGRLSEFSRRVTGFYFRSIGIGGDSATRPEGLRESLRSVVDSINVDPGGVEDS